MRNTRLLIVIVMILFIGFGGFLFGNHLAKQENNCISRGGKPFNGACFAPEIFR